MGAVKMKNQTLLLVAGIVIALLLAIAVYLYTQRPTVPAIPSEQLVQQEVQRQLQALQAESAHKAEEEAARSANPFQAENALQGVQVNPLEKVKDELNPF